MSIVKYTNKKTGYVAVYESTSYYDPVTKQSRPKRKYLGHEDPVTGELIRTTGQKGRRRAQAVQDSSSSPAQTQEKNDDLLAWIKERDELIEKLKGENQSLLSQLNELKSSLRKALELISPYLD